MGNGHNGTGHAGDGAAASAWAARFRAAFDQAPVGMALLALGGRVLRANAALGEMLGRAAAELEATPFRALVHPDDADADLPAAWMVLAGELHAYRAERRFVHADGSAVWGLVSVSAVRDGRGRPAGFVVHVQDVTDRRGLEARLRHRALHDPLTGLPNRACFLDRLARALAGRGQGDEAVAVLLIDLDGFKRVNDRLGHDAGDRLLMAVGQRLPACLRAGDLAARYGGDEFALLVERTRAPGDAAAVAERVLAALRAPVALGATEVAVAASVGVAQSGAGRRRVADLLRAADRALYEAKAAGRSRYAVDEPGRVGHAPADPALDPALDAAWADVGAPLPADPGA